MPADTCVCSTRELYYCKQLGETMRSMLFYDTENKVFASLLKNLKYSTDRGSEKFLSRELSREILILFAKNGEFAKDWCVTYPPRRKSAVRFYGFDQAREMARRISKYTGMTFEEAFSRRGAAAQKALGREERKQNAEDSFSLKRGASVRGKKYVIVDDVVTSGATMKACQTILLSNGASAAFVLSVSKTPMRGAGYDAKLRFRKKKDKAWFNG